MRVTLGMLKAAAAKLGATVREDKVGWLDCCVEAPPGFVWSCDGDIHELVGSCNNGPKEWGWAMRADLLDRMRHGIERCPIQDCEWCADTLGDLGFCAWFEGCPNTATGYTVDRSLGKVRTCYDCHQILTRD